MEGATRRSNLTGTTSGSNSTSHAILLSWLIVCRFSPPKLLRKPMCGVFHLLAKTPRDVPTKYPPRRYCCLGMVSSETRTSQTKQKSASCRGLRKQYPLHISDIGAPLYFPLPRTKIGATNWRHGLRHRDGAKTSSNWRTKNQRHGICHCDGAKNYSPWRGKFKEPQSQRPNPPLYSWISATPFLPSP